MSKSWILSRYLARQYTLWFLAFLFALSGIIFLFEVVELFRRATDLQDATFGIVMNMGLYKLPNTVDRVLPFVVLFSGMFTFWRLTRSQELVIARAAGVSAWQFVSPALMVTFIFSIVNLAVLNPMGTSMNAKYKIMEAKYLQRSASLELTGAGLWLRQKETTDGQVRSYLLHADRVSLSPLTLMPLIAFVYDGENHYLGRVDAPDAILRDSYWEIKDAWFNWEGEMPQHQDEFRLSTPLTLDKIKESMSPPDTISLWKLPSFIRALRSIGLPSTHHELQLQIILAQPLLLCAMVFFAAAFSLRLSRHGRVIHAVIAGLVTGSAVFSLSNVVNAMGINQTLPIILAAWAIPIASMVGGIMALLYLEDG